MTYKSGRSNLSCTIFVPWDCKNNCKFCNSKSLYKSWNKDIDRILDDIEMLNNSKFFEDCGSSGCGGYPEPGPSCGGSGCGFKESIYRMNECGGSSRCGSSGYSYGSGSYSQGLSDSAKISKALKLLNQAVDILSGY